MINTPRSPVGTHGETVGSDVHYVATTSANGAVIGQVIAAKVTQINDNGTVALKLFYPMNVTDNVAVPYNETYQSGCWSWPTKIAVHVPQRPPPLPPSKPSRSVGPVVRLSEFVGNVDKLKEIGPGIITVEDPEIRTDVGTIPRLGAMLSFIYRGPTDKVIPLGNGELRRQMGLRLRSANTCNIVYIMWHIEPTTGIFVSVKSNPNMSTHEQCKDGGYLYTAPATQNPVPLIKTGVRHLLTASFEGKKLRVIADDIVAWEGILRDEAFAFDGPIGVRSDNVKFDFELYPILS